jgi:hypothetical protein
VKRLFERRGAVPVTSITIEGKVYDLTEMRAHAENMLDDAETSVEYGLAKCVLALIDKIKDMNRNVEALL